MCMIAIESHVIIPLMPVIDINNMNTSASNTAATTLISPIRDVNNTAFVGTPRLDNFPNIFGACPCWLSENRVLDAANKAELPIIKFYLH